MDDVKEFELANREKFKKKHLKKVNHLVEKYGRKSKNGWDGLLKEVKEIMGNPEPRGLQGRHDEGGEEK